MCCECLHCFLAGYIISFVGQLNVMVPKETGRETKYDSRSMPNSRYKYILLRWRYFCPLLGRDLCQRITAKITTKKALKITIKKSTPKSGWCKTGCQKRTGLNGTKKAPYIGLAGQCLTLTDRVWLLKDNIREEGGFKLSHLMIFYVYNLSVLVRFNLL